MPARIGRDGVKSLRRPRPREVLQRERGPAKRLASRCVGQQAGHSKQCRRIACGWTLRPRETCKTQHGKDLLHESKYRLGMSSMTPPGSALIVAGSLPAYSPSTCR